MKNYFIRYGHEKLFFNVPESWNVVNLASFDDISRSIDINQLTINSIENPIGTEPLGKQLKPSTA